MSKVSSKFIFKVTQDKLAAISDELYSIKRNSKSADCSFLASVLIDKFHFVESGKPSDLMLDFAYAQQLCDSLLASINRLHFCPVEERAQWLELVHKTASDLSFTLAVLGAFV